MHFRIAPGPSLVGTVRYVPSDYAFNFNPAPDADPYPASYWAIVLGTLQLMVEDTGRVLYPWGYCPDSGWIRRDLRPPASRAGHLYAAYDGEIVPGVAYGVGDKWPVYVDYKRGWICVGDPTSEPSGEAVEFASGSVAILKGDVLTSVWLFPASLSPPGLWARFWQWRRSHIPPLSQSQRREC